jgi:uncharacterized protein DUF4238
MADARRQHYVPQFLLRNFAVAANENQIQAFDKTSSKSYCTNIANVAAENRLIEASIWSCGNSRTADGGGSIATSAGARRFRLIRTLRSRTTGTHAAPRSRGSCLNPEHDVSVDIYQRLSYLRSRVESPDLFEKLAYLVPRGV